MYENLSKDELLKEIVKIEIEIKERKKIYGDEIADKKVNTANQDYDDDMTRLNTKLEELKSFLKK